MTPTVCPNCDGDVPRGARACPECGADETTGWSAGADYERLGVSDPDEPFDYAEFVRNEFGSGQRRGGKQKLVWSITAIVLLIALLAWTL